MYVCIKYCAYIEQEMEGGYVAFGLSIVRFVYAQTSVPDGLYEIAACDTRRFERFDRGGVIGSSRTRVIREEERSIRAS